MTLKYVSICSGIEAASLAFAPLGWKPLAFSEIEPFPCAVLAHQHPAIPNLGDMNKFREWPEEILAECDLLVGGPPCQAFSIAGLRDSLDDDRGNLTLVYVHLIDHIDTIRKKHGKPPVIALYENVVGLLSVRDNAFGCLVGALCGQDDPVETETGKWPTTGILWGAERRVGWRVLDAQYFGLAQRRRRVFVVTVHEELIERLGDGCCPSEILSIAESLRGDTPPRRETREEVTGTISSRTSGGGGLGTDFECSGGLQPVGRRNDLIANTGANGLGVSEEIAPTLDRAQPCAIAYAVQDDTTPKVSRELNGALRRDAGGQGACVMTPLLQVRRLVPVECARLMGFPDSYLDIQFKGKSAADGVKYRALGNSMAIPVMAYLGRKIQEALDTALI